MLNPIFAHRLEQHHPVPRAPTNEERMQAYRALAPVQFGNTVFNPRRQSEAAASRGALADGGFSTEAARPLGDKSAKAAARRQGLIAPDASTLFDPDPPTPEEVAEAYQFSYGA